MNTGRVLCAVERGADAPAQKMLRAVPHPRCEKRLTYSVERDFDFSRCRRFRPPGGDALWCTERVKSASCGWKSTSAGATRSRDLVARLERAAPGGFWRYLCLSGHGASQGRGAARWPCGLTSCDARASIRVGLLGRCSAWSWRLALVRCSRPRRRQRTRRPRGSPPSGLPLDEIRERLVRRRALQGRWTRGPRVSPTRSSPGGPARADLGDLGTSATRSRRWSASSIA